MIICTTDHIVKKIEKAQFKFAKIYEGFVINATENKPVFEKIDSDSPDALIAEIKDFADLYKDKFTILMRRHNGGNDATVTCVRWSTEDQVKQVEAQPVTTAPFDFEAEKKKWLLEMQQEIKLQTLQNEVAMKEAELTDLKTSGGKLSFIAMQMLSAWGKTRGVNMQGFDNNVSQPTNGTVTQDELKEALDKIVSMIGLENIVKLANKLEPDSMELNMVINFANS